MQYIIVKLARYSFRARNNFRIVSGHDDRPNSFLLGHVSFLAGQMYMINSSFRESSFNMTRVGDEDIEGGSENF